MVLWTSTVWCAPPLRQPFVFWSSHPTVAAGVIYSEVYICCATKIARVLLDSDRQKKHRAIAPPGELPETCPSTRVCRDLIPPPPPHESWLCFHSRFFFVYTATSTQDFTRPRATRLPSHFVQSPSSAAFLHRYLFGGGKCCLRRPARECGLKRTGSRFFLSRGEDIDSVNSTLYPVCWLPPLR